MEVTDVSISRMFRDRQILAVCTVTVDNAIAIHDIKLCDGKEGMYIKMPYKISDGQMFNVCHPLNTSVRKQITDAVINKYNQIKEEHI